MPFMKSAFVLVMLCTPLLAASENIPSAKAKDHVGETATVCGKVADSRYMDGSNVTFLNFDQPYPNHTFTAFIPAENRAKFGTPEKDYKDKDVCVTGKIQDYKGKPEIILAEPSQIKVDSK
jgi:DNA/RNA endonuclease YhcR with UshA esterase domain